MVDLPPPPEDMPTGTFTKQDWKNYKRFEKAMRTMLVTVQEINTWTDSLSGRVNPNTLDRRTRDEVGQFSWQAEFIARTLRHSVPPLAVIEMVRFMQDLHGDSVEVKNMSEAEAKQQGYL